MLTCTGVPQLSASNASCMRPQEAVPTSSLGSLAAYVSTKYSPPPYLHTASNQRLEVGTAWEQGLIHVQLCHSSHH